MDSKQLKIPICHCSAFICSLSVNCVRKICSGARTTQRMRLNREKKIVEKRRLCQLFYGVGSLKNIMVLNVLVHTLEIYFGFGLVVNFSLFWFIFMHILVLVNVVCFVVLYCPSPSSRWSFTSYAKLTERKRLPLLN